MWKNYEMPSKLIACFRKVNIALKMLHDWHNHAFNNFAMYSIIYDFSSELVLDEYFLSQM